MHFFDRFIFILINNKIIISCFKASFYSDIPFSVKFELSIDPTFA